MWYVKASVENSVNTLSEELITARVRKAFLKKYSRFPDSQELKMFINRITSYIKRRHNSIYYMRKEQLEKKILKLIDEILEESNFDASV